jgi:hypothetical protein
VAYCPSHDWDRYCAAQELPEQCPVCGRDNADEEGEPVYAPDPAFCSQACAEQYAKEQEVESAALAASYRDE